MATLLAGAAVFGLMPAAARSGEPLRSGTILGGVFTTTYPAPCVPRSVVPECHAWHASGCNPALAGRNPSWLMSIENVADLADGSTWRRFQASPTKSVPGGVGLGLAAGGVVVQFWTSDCQEVPTGPWRYFRGDGARTSSYLWTRANGNYTDLEVPLGATWITVLGMENLNISWSLS